MIATPALRRLTREVVKLQKSPPDGIGIEVGEQDILDIDGWIQGPAGTPYADGFFKVNFQFIGTDFPAGPPKCSMRTKIFHPNIHANGEICVSTLKKDWNPSYGIEHILTVIKCLLISPNPDSALDPEAASLLQEAYEEYASTASIWTRIHASYRPGCMPETINVRPSVSSSRSFEQPSGSKKMEVEEVNITMENALGAAAQPLARSGSTNANLHHKASFDLQGVRAGATLQQQQCVSPNRSANSISAATILQSGTAAAAAAASAAAMTAAMTAGMNKVSLQDSTLIPASKMSIFDQHEIKSSFARKRVPVVRRGIKRL
ncbi:UBC-like protein [Meira miltonrushii]|uniref:E2 ubiquitin-conjugating enzyme n=1 Tax=Meira miltonrushii TaxID=1280837 RepID=A0A316VJP1_9BASI|nr:UBC-like protein [Meira miltonrushii]PWN37720.1 UBC-like protein [Meira miltonrushii]